MNRPARAGHVVLAGRSGVRTCLSAPTFPTDPDPPVEFVKINMAGTAHTAVAAAKVLSPLLGWRGADLVRSPGKMWFPLFLASTLCAFVIYQRCRPGEPGSGG